MFNYGIPSLEQMKLISLIDFTLILILAFNSTGEAWNVNVSRHINATKGSNVIIECCFTVPQDETTESVKIFWKTPENNTFDNFVENRNAFIFHPNDTFVLEKYRGRTQLIGNKSTGNCSLKIFNISENFPNIYVRVSAKWENFSFIDDFVSISVSEGRNEENEALPYVAICVPVVAILVLIFVVGVVLGMKRKRSASLIRDESGYYANFSRANQQQREASGQKQENSRVSEQKDIEDPVYINIEAPPHQMDQIVDHVDNIYANVDSIKL